MIVANDTIRVWKENIPAHWQVLPLKYTITYNDDKLTDQKAAEKFGPPEAWPPGTFRRTCAFSPFFPGRPPSSRPGCLKSGQARSKSGRDAG